MSLTLPTAVYSLGAEHAGDCVLRSCRATAVSGPMAPTRTLQKPSALDLKGELFSPFLYSLADRLSPSSARGFGFRAIYVLVALM